jgi:hypothetical protein
MTDDVIYPWSDPAVPKFATPHECLVDFQQKIFNTPYGQGERKGEKQFICERCRRWKYFDQRCNLFVNGGRA